MLSVSSARNGQSALTLGLSNTQLNHSQQNTQRRNLIGAYGPSDCYNCSPLPYNPAFTPNQFLHLQSRYGRYQNLTRQFLYHRPYNEQQSTRFALLQHNTTNTSRQLLTNGVSSGQINRGEFHTLARFQQETEYLRARLREGGYSPAEVDLINGRMSQYRNLQQSFLSHDFRIPVRTNGSQADQRLDQAFQRASFANYRGDSNGSKLLLKELNWSANNAYGAGAQQRQGNVYDDERKKLRTHFKQQRNEFGIQDPTRTRRQSTPLNFQERSQASGLVGRLNAQFDRLDQNRDGRIKRGELKAILANPEQYGFSPEEAAALYMNQDSLSRIHDPGRQFEEDLTRQDLAGVNGCDPKAVGRQESAFRGVLGAMKAKERPVTNTLFGGDGRPDPLSIQQGREGSCWLLAAASQLRPEQIQRMMSVNKDGNVVVRFPGRPPEIVTPLTKAEKRVYSRADGDWIAYLEKAGAQAYAREGRDINGGRGKYAMELLTGQRGVTVDFRKRPQGGPDGRDPRVVGSLINDAVRNGRMVTASTRSNDYDKGVSNLASSSHAYSVVGFDAATGTVILRNPWGRNELADRDGQNDGLFRMSIQEFQATFSDMDIQPPRRR